MKIIRNRYSIVGYSPGTKGYQVWIPEVHKFYIFHQNEILLQNRQILKNIQLELRSSPHDVVQEISSDSIPDGSPENNIKYLLRSTKA